MKRHFARLLKPNGRSAFLAALPPHPTILDVGCGNDSPLRTKALRPDSRYIGVDVGIYNQSPKSLSLVDEYVTVPATGFADALDAYRGSVDAVVSSHNLEHCDEPKRVLRAMLGALGPGGWIFMAFPSERSVGLPSRKGTLNFYDDPSHRCLPQFSEVIDAMLCASVRPIVQCRQHRPLLPAAMGLVLEPLSLLSNKVMPFGSTWALYGFESVIWGQKHHA